MVKTPVRPACLAEGFLSEAVESQGNPKIFGARKPVRFG
jgi:hypothetical protein